MFKRTESGRWIDTYGEFIVGFMLFGSAFVTNIYIYEKIFGLNSYVVNEVFQSFLSYALTIVFGFYAKHIFNSKKELFASIFRLDIFRKLRAELRFVRNSNSSIKRNHLASILHEQGLINIHNPRIRFKYEEVCVGATIRAHRFLGKKEQKKLIAEEICTNIDKRDIDYLLSSKTAANELLSNQLTDKLGIEKHYFYGLLSNGDVTLDLNSLAATGKDEFKFVIVETTLITPKMIYRVSKLLDNWAEKLNVNINIAAVCIVFNGHNDTGIFKAMPIVKYISLFELNHGLLPSGECRGCYSGECSDLKGISVEKSYITI